MRRPTGGVCGGAIGLPCHGLGGDLVIINGRAPDRQAFLPQRFQKDCRGKPVGVVAARRIAGQPNLAAFDLQKTSKRYSGVFIYNAACCIVLGHCPYTATGNIKVSNYSSVHGFNIKRAAGDNHIPTNSTAGTGKCFDIQCTAVYIDVAGYSPAFKHILRQIDRWAALPFHTQDKVAFPQIFEGAVIDV